MGYTKGVRWTDELIKERILEVKNALELDRMPSAKECRNYFHDERLVNAVSKRKGWYALAEELGLRVKESETYFGKKHETITSEILMSKGFSVRRMAQNFPYDLLVDDCVKIDVKASRLYRGPNGNFYTFNLEKDFATCDIYVLFAINEREEKIYVVPSKFVIANNQISIGEKASKYGKFIDKWEYIKSLSDYWFSIA